MRRPLAFPALGLLIFPVALAGCASMQNLHSGVSPKIRTVASVGDKPVSVTTGEPGQTITAESDLPDRRQAKSEGRISGRVVDEQGEPVPFARVRLAVGGTPGGKVIRATTDRSGGFTLRGLRPGSSYTVIAEWEDGAALLTGRSDVQAPDTDVRISLAPSVARTAQGARRVDPISTREDEEPVDEGRVLAEEAPASRPGQLDVKELPPAREADAYAPARVRNARAGAPPRWRRAGLPAEAKPEPEPEADQVAGAAPRLHDEGTNPRSSRSAPGPRVPPVSEPSSPDDEGPNPLPPALEPEKASYRPQRRESVESSTLVAHETEPPAQEVPPGALVAVPPSTTPVAFSEVPASAGPEELKPPAEFEPTSPPAPPVPAGGPRRRPTWRELTQAESPPPAPTDPAEPIAAAPAKEDVYCHYDTRHRRIEDFRLPDPDGKLVRFQDLDADLILLDFWGTWCQPCLQSVPHLVDLQSRIDGRKLKVVGIACEQGPPAKRGEQVARAARQLGINYTLLVSSTDGDCPLQQALHIQAYPTLILVDRQGRVLWQDQGATPLTLARLDRMLSQTLQADDRRRF
jgi:thiol-disulfide isomerase/thioredoxin